MLFLLAFTHSASAEKERVVIKQGKFIAAGYDDQTYTMSIEYKKGKRVEYSGVMYSTYSKFVDAEDKKAFFKENIKGKFSKTVSKVKKAKKKKKRKKKKRKKRKKKKKQKEE